MISDFGLGLIFVVFLKQWVYILIIVLVLLGIAISILSWKKEYMLLKGDEAHYHKGVFSKNTTIIPKKSFKSMDISQNLIERILGYKIVKLKVPLERLEKKILK